MIAIAKETLAPLHFESLRQKHRTNADGLVPEIVSAFLYATEFASALALRKSQHKRALHIRRSFIHGSTENQCRI